MAVTRDCSEVRRSSGDEYAATVASSSFVGQLEKSVANVIPDVVKNPAVEKSIIRIKVVTNVPYHAHSVKVLVGACSGTDVMTNIAQTSAET